MKLRLEPLTVGKLDAFRALLGSPEFGGCFCAVWTSYGEDWLARCEDPAQPNFLLTQGNVRAGRHIGFLVYEAQTLVAWTGSGPKTAFPFLKTKLASRLSAFSPEIWSIGCLAVKQDFRGTGLPDRIVLAIMEEARSQGASLLEAYPTRPFDAPRIFRGTCQLYQRLGFKEAGAETDAPHEILLMQLPLTAAVTY